jgi:hypothetical protein
MSHSPRVSSVGAVCAILVVVCFVLGAVLMGASGVESLIPETGRRGLNWIADVDAASGIFFAGAWLVVLSGLLGIVAFVGIYGVLRGGPGDVIVLAPVLGTVGLTLVTVSHLLPISLAYEFVPSYTVARSTAQPTLAATFDTMAATALVTNSAGNFLGFGVAVPMFAVAILKTGRLPRWIGWLGLLVGVLAGWLGLLTSVSEVFEGISTIGFLGFFVFMVGIGVAVLRRRGDRKASDHVEKTGHPGEVA